MGNNIGFPALNRETHRIISLLTLKDWKGGWEDRQIDPAQVSTIDTCVCRKRIVQVAIVERYCADDLLVYSYRNQKLNPKEFQNRECSKDRLPSKGSEVVQC